MDGQYLQGSDCNEPKPVYSDLNQRVKEPKLADLSVHEEPGVLTLLRRQIGRSSESHLPHANSPNDSRSVIAAPTLKYSADSRTLPPPHLLVPF